MGLGGVTGTKYGTSHDWDWHDWHDWDWHWDWHWGTNWHDSGLARVIAGTHLARLCVSPTPTIVSRISIPNYQQEV